jgi:hypothetical protein
MPRRPTFYVWHIEAVEGAYVGEVKGFVVVAQTEKNARAICHRHAADEIEQTHDYWTNPKHTECTKIGIAWKKEERMVLRDYFGT